MCVCGSMCVIVMYVMVNCAINTCVLLMCVCNDVCVIIVINVIMAV
jgi:hypothetical protein